MKPMYLLKTYNEGEPEDKGTLVAVFDDKNLLELELNFLIESGEITYQNLPAEEGRNKFCEDTVKIGFDAENHLDNAKVEVLSEMTRELEEFLNEKGVTTLNQILKKTNVGEFIKDDEDDEDEEEM